MNTKRSGGTGKSPAPAPTPTPLLDAMVRSEPDLVDRIFDYVVQLVPAISERRDEIKDALREEFAGERVYVRRRDRPGSRGSTLAAEILRLFNGRNASEVARQLRISRATVYRKIRQPGDAR